MTFLYTIVIVKTNNYLKKPLKWVNGTNPVTCIWSLKQVLTELLGTWSQSSHFTIRL